MNGLDDLENFDPNVKGAVKNGVEHEDNILSGRRVGFAPNVFIRFFGNTFNPPGLPGYFIISGRTITK